MKKTSSRLLVLSLPFLFIGTLQLAGCLRRELPPPAPGGAYRSTSGGARFDQSVRLVDEKGDHIDYIASLPLLTIHRVSTAPATLFAIASQAGAVVSHDDGVTWRKINQPLASITGLVALKNGVLLASGTNQDNAGLVTRSLDSGVSWEDVLTIPAFKKPKSQVFEVIKPPPPPPVFVSSLALDPFHEDHVYAATSTGDLLAGEQSGKVWNNILTASSPIRKVSSSPHQEGELLLVTTNGQLFRVKAGQAETIKLPERAKALDVVYIRQFPNAILVSSDNGVFISRDRGDTWLELPLPISTSAPLRSVVARVSPTNPDRFLVSVDSVLYRSEDGGETWNALSLNLPNHIITDISIDPVNAARVLLVTSPLGT